MVASAEDFLLLPGEQLHKMVTRRRMCCVRLAERIIITDVGLPGHKILGSLLHEACNLCEWLECGSVEMVLYGLLDYWLVVLAFCRGNTFACSLSLLLN